MKNLIVIILVILNVSFAKEVILTSSNNLQLEKELNKDTNKQIKKQISAGEKFLKNKFSNLQEARVIDIEEIYTKKITKDWTGGIFSISIIAENENLVKKTIKLFYNKELIVEDIFTTTGESLSKYLNLPIINPVSIYNKEFKINKRDKTKKSLYGINMVIFSDVLCPFCKQSMSSLIDFGKKYNMNIYLLEVAPIIHPNSSTISLLMNTAIKIEPNRTLEIVKNTYEIDFPKNKVDTKVLLEIFNRKNKTNLTINDLSKYKMVNKLNKSEKIAKQEYIQGTPTVFVDEKRFDIQKAINDSQKKFNKQYEEIRK